MALVRTVQNAIEMIAALLTADDDIQILRLLNEAHLEITDRCGLIPLTNLNVNLTSGTQEYALPDTVMAIDDAAYYTSATASTPLRPTNIDSLFEDYGPNWRQNIGQGQPYTFYEVGGMIGFVPIPATTTSTGFPIVTLKVLQYTELTLDDNLPTTISSIQPYVLHVARSYAMATDPTKVQAYTQQFEYELKKQQDFVWRRVKRDKPRIFARVPRVHGA